MSQCETHNSKGVVEAVFEEEGESLPIRHENICDKCGKTIYVTYKKMEGQDNDLLYWRIVEDE